MKQTVKSCCPVCDGVLESRPIKFGLEAMIVCAGCCNIVTVKVEEVTAIMPVVTKIPEPIKINVHSPLPEGELLKMASYQAKALVLEMDKAGYRSYSIARHVGLGTRLIKAIIKEEKES
jgi:hypothetical protein